MKVKKLNKSRTIRSERDQKVQKLNTHTHTHIELTGPPELAQSDSTQKKLPSRKQPGADTSSSRMMAFKKLFNIRRSLKIKGFVSDKKDLESNLRPIKKSQD